MCAHTVRAAILRSKEFGMKRTWFYGLQKKPATFENSGLERKHIQKLSHESIIIPIVVSSEKNIWGPGKNYDLAKRYFKESLKKEKLLGDGA
jgi:hypothetical protein